MIAIKTILTADPLYKKELELRDQVLRKPIGMNIEDDDLSDEGNQIHFVAVKGEELVGVVVLKIDVKTGKLRQMAVKPELQGQNIGRKLVTSLEEKAKQMGLDEIKLHARHYAVGFYEKLNYQVANKPSFIEVGMDHFEMEKAI
jgi:ribosomal protein S18 acetylase RimI-like enzyme